MKRPSADHVERDHNKVVNHFFHDFHGQISTIEMCVGAVRDRNSPASPCPNRDCLQRVIDNCEHMVRLIKNFRDRTQMEEGCYPRAPETLALSPMFARLADLWSTAALERRIQVQLGAPSLPAVSLRAGLLERALENLGLQLIDNTRLDGAFIVDAALDLSVLRVSLRFEGEELDPAVGATVFDPVAQADVGLRLGRGYTMLFCKEALAYMGGDIHILRWPGHGNELVATVPVELAGDASEHVR